MFQIHFLRGTKQRKEWKECPWCRILCHFRKPRHTSFLSAFSLIPSCARPTDHFLGTAGALPTAGNQMKPPNPAAEQREALVPEPGNSATFRPRQAAALQLFLEHQAAVLHNRTVWHVLLSNSVGVFTWTKITITKIVPEMGFTKAPTFSSWIHTILLRHKQCSKYK